MDLLAKVRNLFGVQPVQPIAPPAPESDPDEVVVPEMSVAELRAALADAPAADAPLLLLDVREQYEWNQVHIAGALHIPMNHIPDRLADLPGDRPIAVLCAHGSRSYGVTHFLREQGVDARNVTGGITQWQIQGGPVEVKTKA